MLRHPDNPLITREQVTPSHPSYRVRGAFNPGATIFEDQIILLLRVAEDCPAPEGRVRVPVARFEDGRGHFDMLDLLDLEQFAETQQGDGFATDAHDFAAAEHGRHVALPGA